MDRWNNVQSAPQNKILPGFWNIKSKSSLLSGSANLATCRSVVSLASISCERFTRYSLESQSDMSEYFSLLDDQRGYLPILNSISCEAWIRDSSLPSKSDISKYSSDLKVRLKLAIAHLTRVWKILLFTVTRQTNPTSCFWTNDKFAWTSENVTWHRCLKLIGPYKWNKNVFLFIYRYFC